MAIGVHSMENIGYRAYTSHNSHKQHQKFTRETNTLNATVTYVCTHTTTTKQFHGISREQNNHTYRRYHVLLNTQHRGYIYIGVRLGLCKPLRSDRVASRVKSLHECKLFCVVFNCVHSDQTVVYINYYTNYETKIVVFLTIETISPCVYRFEFGLNFCDIP